MKRFHVQVAVSDLEQSIRFYSTLFGGEPSVQKEIGRASCRERV